MTLLNAVDASFVPLRAGGSQTVAEVIDRVLVGLNFNAQGQFTGLDFNFLPNFGAIVPLGIGIAV